MSITLDGTSGITSPAVGGNPLLLKVNGATKAQLSSTGAFTLTDAALQEKKVAISASAIDLATGNYFTKTISATTTFTVSNTATSGQVSSFVLELTNGGAATVNWFSGVQWPGGVAPSLTTSGKDVLGFYTHNGGSSWTGLVLGKDVKAA